MVSMDRKYWYSDVEVGVLVVYRRKPASAVRTGLLAQELHSHTRIQVVYRHQGHSTVLFVSACRLMCIHAKVP